MITEPSLQVKNVIRLCPLLSNAISYEKTGPNGERVRVHELARSPCIKGDCEMWNPMLRTCELKKGGKDDK